MGTDPLVGAFRRRSESGQEVKTWRVTTAQAGTAFPILQADNMHQHLKKQGGAGSEAKKQATRYVAATVMKQIPCVGAFAPSTKADTRYWVTMPGFFYVGYIPLDPGSYQLTVAAFDKKDLPVTKYSKTWSGIEIGEGHRSLLVSSGYSPAASVIPVASAAEATGTSQQ